MVTIIALPLYALAETGSAAATGITGFFATLPIVLGGVLGGVVVDRLGYRRASVLADVARGATSVLVPIWTQPSACRSRCCSLWCSSAACSTRRVRAPATRCCRNSRLLPVCRWSVQ